MKNIFLILLSVGLTININGQEQIQTELGSKSDFIYNDGNIGIGTTNPEGNLQIGSSTTNGMLFLGGGKGYSGIGSTRSDGGLVLGNNIYARYDDSSDNWNARVGKSKDQGYSGIKITRNGVIDFFGHNGAVTADEIANTDSSIRMKIDKSGAIGIGTTNPVGNLQIGKSTTNGMLFLGGGKGASGIGSTRSDGGLVLGNNIYARYDDSSDNWNARVGKSRDQGYSGIKITQNGVIDFFGHNGAVTADEIANTDSSIRMKIDKSGNVGIGTTNPDGWKLAVNGKIRATEIKVETGWSDFVFYDDYELPTLTAVENHIKEKGHLKDIPSAKEVEENGVLLGEMDSKLLQKIEELTLYTIEQEKKITTQNEKIQTLEALNKKFTDLQTRLEKLEKSN